MNVLHRIRRNSGRLARVNLALFALVWLSIVVAPCAMALQAGAQMSEHDCPHCPPRPCHEVTPQDCDETDSLDSLRVVDKTETTAILPPRALEPAPADAADASHGAIAQLPPVRAGPRPHLLNAQFNE